MPCKPIHRALALIAALIWSSIASAGFLDKVLKEIKKGAGDIVNKSVGVDQGSQQAQPLPPPIQEEQQTPPTRNATANTPEVAGDGSLLQPLQVNNIEGRPTLDFADYLRERDSVPAFRRFLELLVVSSDPGVLSPPASVGGRDPEGRNWDYMIRDFALRHMTEPARLPYFSQRRDQYQRIVMSLDWKGSNEFEKRDAMQAFIKEVRPQIQAAAKKQ